MVESEDNGLEVYGGEGIEGPETFPGPKGSTVTYGKYEGENRIRKGTVTFEVEKKQGLGTNMVSKVRVRGDGKSVPGYWLIDNIGRCVYQKSIRSPNLEVSLDYENGEVHAHVIGTDLENTVDMPSSNVGVVTSFPELIFSAVWWESIDLPKNRVSPINNFLADHKSENWIQVRKNTNYLGVHKENRFNAPAGSFSAYEVWGFPNKEMKRPFSKIWVSKLRNLPLMFGQKDMKVVYMLDNFSGL